MKKLLLLGSILGAGFLPAAAIAQDEDAATVEAAGQEAATEDQEDGLAVITVTAQRREENLQSAALAISAVTGDQLAAAGVTKPTELTNLVPALQVAPAAGPYNLFYLRGVGNFNGNAFSDSAVAFNADGVFIGRPSSTTGFFYDLERVEVLKGPQGTLYGRNATGGAINVISAKPELGRFGAAFSAEYGNHDTLRLDASVNVPLGDIAAVRAAGIRVRHDGYMNDGTDDQDDWGGRLSLRVEPTDTLTIDVVGDYFDQGGNGVGSTPLAAVAGNPLPTNFRPEDRIGFLSPQGQAFYASQPNTLLGRTFTPITLAPFQDNEFWGISSTIDWETSVGTLTVVPAYRESSIDYLNFMPGFFIRQQEETNQTSVEARFQTDQSNPLRLLVGAFYYDEQTNDPLVAYEHQSNVNIQTFSLDTESQALFGRLTYAVTPEFRLTLGGRYTWEQKELEGLLQAASRVCVVPSSYFPAYVPGCPTAQPIPYDLTVPAPDFVPFPGDGTITTPPSIINNLGANSRDASFEEFTYRLAADWDVGDQNLLYASYETGFKSGGFFFSSDAGIYRPEKIKAFTLGSKNRFFDNRLQLNAEAFYWRYRDQQISHLGLDSAGIAIFPTENVGKATFKGAEVEIQYLLTENTTLSADVQYLDGTYNDFVYTTPNLNGGIGNGTGCPNGAAPAAVYTVDCSGFRPPNAPKWTVNLGAQQVVPLGNGGDIVLDARTHFQTDTLTGLEFVPVEVQDDYWLADGAITYYAPERRYFVGAFVNNAFNEGVVSSTFPTPFSLFYSATLRPPRTYGIRAGLEF